MGLFDVFKRGLAKTRDKLAAGFRTILPFGRKIDEPLLDHPHTPHQVVINEAVDLARHFGGNESAAFVNGVLDGVRKAVDTLTASPATERETRRHADTEEGREGIGRAGADPI